MTRRKVLLAVLLSFVLGGVCGWFLPRLAPKPPSEPPPKPSSEPPPIDSGFFFYRGAYVSPPYRVRLDEDGVKINGICIDPRSNVSLRRPRPDKDPGPFKWTPELEAKGPSKSGFFDNAIERFYFWEKLYGFDEACNRYEQYMKQQPVFSKVERVAYGHFGIRYWTKDGQENGMSISPPPLKGSRPRAVVEEETLKSSMESNRRRLLQGGAIIVLRGSLLISPGSVLRKLPRIYEIAASNKSNDEKVNAFLAAPELYIDPRDEAETFVAGFRDSPSLKERVNALALRYREYRKLMEGKRR